MTHSDTQKSTNSINSLTASSVVHAQIHTAGHADLSGVTVCALTMRSADGSDQPCVTLPLCQKIKGKNLVRP